MSENLTSMFSVQRRRLNYQEGWTDRHQLGLSLHRDTCLQVDLGRDEVQEVIDGPLQCPARQPRHLLPQEEGPSLSEAVR